MHAFLIVGQANSDFDSEIAGLSKKIHAKIIEFPLQKIEDVRNLNNLVRLSFNEPTLIVSRNINMAGEEALNAFLKNLEEPQENIYFALTATSEKSVLSTIVSRCQVVKITDYKLQITNGGEIKQFLEMSKSEKLLFFDKLKDRNNAIEFINNLIFFLHNKKDFQNIEILIKTLMNLKKNGNISLHLTNLVARMESTHG